MSKTRTVSKYTVASGVTALYSAVIYRKLRGVPDEPVAPHRVAAVGAMLIAATWLTALL